MQLVILAGGLGSRLSEETQIKPKPLVEVGNMPIIWHIMKIYSHYGINDFVICLGYKAQLIKEYFANLQAYTGDFTINPDGSKTFHGSNDSSWTITLVDTGQDTQTGGRLKRVLPFIKEETFFMTYGDGLSDVNIKELFKFHTQANRLATVTAVRPSARFGALEINELNVVTAFVEKPIGESGRINGGFFVLNKKVGNYVKNDETLWEEEPMKGLAKDGQLGAFIHDGFWQPMDTLREKNMLEESWNTGNAPWKVWS